MNIYVISSSLRENSNTELMAKYFYKGAEEKGHEVKFLSLKDFNLNFCTGCMMCHDAGKCSITDDMDSIIDDIKNSDILVFATPVYYYGLSGKLKAFLDRLNPLYESDYKFEEIYLLTACADTDPSIEDRICDSLCGWVECFPNAGLVDSVIALGVNDPNSVPIDILMTCYNKGLDI